MNKRQKTKRINLVFLLNIVKNFVKQLKVKILLSLYIYLLSFVICLITPFIVKADVLDEISDTLANITCETEGVGELLRVSNAHTCMTTSLTAELLKSVTGISYFNTLLKLKIRDEELFPDSCSIKNRLDPNNPRITFAICNNVKLQIQRVVGLANATVAIASSLFTGKNPWDDISKMWNIPKSSYHDIMRDKKEGDWGITLDVPPVSWQVSQIKDRVCVMSQSNFGLATVGCKYIREPFPESIYSAFIHGEENIASSNFFVKKDSLGLMLTSCQRVSDSCYKRANQASKTGIVMTAPIVECAKEMASRLLVNKDVCNFDEVTSKLSSNVAAKSSLVSFQENMKSFIKVLLTLYIVIFCIKIALSPDTATKTNIIIAILKIIFVTYCCLGVNTGFGSSSQKNDGISQIILPFLVNTVSALSSIVTDHTNSGLCSFNKNDYPSSMRDIAAWDSLDCFISHYLGLDMISSMALENFSTLKDFQSFDNLSFPVPPYYYLLIPALLSHNLTLVSLALAYPLLVISVAAYVINLTVASIIFIIVLSVMGVIFVPMVLFSFTYGYFSSWFKLLLSFSLQPMVAVLFINVVFAIYNLGFYGQCKYTNSQVQSGGRSVKIFYIDDNWNNYTKEEIYSCKNSLGYLLNYPFAMVSKMIGNNLDNSSLVKNLNPSTYIKKFSFLSSKSKQGVFFSTPIVLFEQVKQITISLTICCLLLYLLYHFSSQLSEFAADITEGVSMSAVTINPQSLYKAGQAAINSFKKGAEASNNTTNRQAPGDKQNPSGDNQARDLAATNSGGNEKLAEDKIATSSSDNEKKAEDKLSTN